MMKKRLLTVMLTLAMALSPVPAYAEEFSDGAVGIEVEPEEPASDVDLFAAPEEDAIRFSDDGGGVAAEVEEAAETEQDVLGAQDTYQISVSGKLILSETEEFVRLLNKERKKAGLQPVEIDQRLMDVAIERAIEGSIVYGHIRPDGSRIPLVAECASGSGGGARGYFRSWKTSPAHWELLMYPDSTKIGFAIFNGTGYANLNGYGNSEEYFGGPVEPYTGGFEDRNISKYHITILGKYLNMDNNWDSEKMYVTGKKVVKPRILVYDTYHENNCGSSQIDGINGYWENNNPKVVALDQEGNVVALKEGEATVKFYVNGDVHKCFEWDIYVVDPWEIKDGRKYYYDPETGEQASGWKTINGKLYHFYYPWGKYKYEGSPFELWERFSDNQALENVDVKIDGEWYSFDGEGIAIKLDGKPSYKAPVAPSLKGTVLNRKNVKLSWNQPANAKGYQIFRYDSKTRKYKRVKTIVSGNTLSYTIKQGYGKTSKYKIRAFNIKADGTRAYGNFGEAIAIKTATVKPAITSVKSQGSGGMEIRWNKIPGAEGYQVYRSTNTDGNFVRVKTVNGNTMRYVDTGLAKGQVYYYKIRTYRKNGKSKVYSANSIAFSGICK